MKKISILLLSLVMGGFSLQAQTADKIIGDYHEATGGAKAWEGVKGIKMKASVNQGGMEIPLEIIQLKSGKQLVKINLQGQEIVQSAFDGEVLWTTNFQTMKPEKMDSEMLLIQKQESEDFPDALLNYKKRGYKAELVGSETIDGVDTYKVKLTKKPITVDGKEVENITYYFFDKENSILIAQESEVQLGPQKGVVSQTLFSDYQEVDGLYFPFSITQGVKGQGGQPVNISEVVVNPEVDNSDFAFPAESSDAEPPMEEDGE